MNPEHEKWYCKECNTELVKTTVGPYCPNTGCTRHGLITMIVKKKGGRSDAWGKQTWKRETITVNGVWMDRKITKREEW